MKVAVYTIALNEAAHAERWANSAADADYRIVADTGSTDDTVELLIKAGVTVHRIAVRPWRFDVARNAAMALIPADVDVCCSMDMDRYLEPGWRAKLEEAWTPEMTALFCWVSYRASADDPTQLRGWPAKNFHHRWGYRFRRPVHEALVFTGEKEVTSSRNDLVMCEVQDHDKGTRSQYLPLMELAHKEDPDDAQICFWLGRDYMWGNQHDKASELLQRYLALPTSTWTEERSEAMRYLARMQPDKKMIWLDKARMEAPHRREIWHDLAEELHGKQDWLNLFWACSNGIEKTHRTGSYLDDNHCWGFRLFDLGAIASWHLNAMDRAVELGRKALELDPNNQRLKNNLDFFILRCEQDRLGDVKERLGRTTDSRGRSPVIEYAVDERGRLVEVPLFRPVIYTMVYGLDLYYECLRLFLSSLENYGNYRGLIKIVSDRSLDQLLQYVPETIRERISHVSIHQGDWMQRYDINALGLQEYSPILHLDNDIIVNGDLTSVLRAICSHRQVCVTTETETYPELSMGKISQVSDRRRIGNWWGLEMFRADPSCSEEVLPLANAGIMGFSDHSVFAMVAKLVTELYRSPSHASMAKWFGDQPFLNYALVKTKLGEYEILREACSFLGSSGSFPTERRGFAHFVWARNEEKPRQMAHYLRQLDTEAGRTIKSGADESPS